MCASACNLFKPTGEPDRLGSYSQINQVIARGPDWKQIVKNSSFQLGTPYVAGNWLENGKPVDFYGCDFGTYPRIDGSTVAVPMAMEFARQHLGFSDENAYSFVFFHTTHEAYLNLILKQIPYAGEIGPGVFQTANNKPIDRLLMNNEHPVDLIIATEPSAEELATAAANQVKLVVKPVCYDAFVFITHKDNPVDSLTLDQIRGIYSGTITNWKELGGVDAPIVAYQREENSGSQTGMLNLVMGDVPMLPPETVQIAWGMGELVDAVAEYKNNTVSIGYTYKYYIDTLYKNENIKILKIDGMSPDEISLRKGTYPLTTNYYGVIRGGDEAKVGGLFLNWMLSVEGQECIRQAGYVPYFGY